MKEKYLSLLAENFKTRQDVITEVINLEAILNLPKGTEHFVSDLHGEFEAFDHVLRNGSGNVKAKIRDLFANRLSKTELLELTTLVYYPEDQLVDSKKHQKAEQEQVAWYKKTLALLVELTAYAGTKYTRSKLRKSMPEHFSYIMEEMLYNLNNHYNKEDYYAAVVDTLIRLEQADALIIAFCYTIQRLVVDHLHVVGDVFDRGPAPDKIIERLMCYHSVDIQWGNHDMLWMGAVCGSKLCMANLVRICARYGNLDIIEDVYGINLRPLFVLAAKYYHTNPKFTPKQMSGRLPSSQEEIEQVEKVHQAIAIIQFKLEQQAIARRPEFKMEHRQLLDKVDYQANTLTVHGKTYPLVNTCFDLIDTTNTGRLTPEEEEVVDKLIISFQNSEKLRRHINFFFEHGSLYLIYNNNLLIHGCIPLNEDGTPEQMLLNGKERSGRELLDCYEYFIRESYSNVCESDDFATDMIWYLWSGAKSPLFGKREMTTFERYFIEDKTAHFEAMNPYYRLREQEEVCSRLLEEFGIDPTKGHIINGHTPVREIKGENPIKANGKLIVIDGGYSRAYQKETGIAGYTLLYNSYGMELAAHQPFTSREDAIKNGTDIISTRRVVDEEQERQKIRETNIGQQLQKRSKDLQDLLEYSTRRNVFQERGYHKK